MKIGVSDSKIYDRDTGKNLGKVWRLPRVPSYNGGNSAQYGWKLNEQKWSETAETLNEIQTAVENYFI